LRPCGGMFLENAGFQVGGGSCRRRELRLAWPAVGVPLRPA
jgi:hypothetical protein